MALMTELCFTPRAPSRPLARHPLLRSAIAVVALASFAATYSDIATADPGQVLQPAPGMHVRARHSSRDAADDLLGDALRDVKLRAEQRTQIDQIKKDAREQHAALRASRRVLLEATASQMEAAKFDRSSLKAPVDAMMQAFTKDSRVERTALDKLHAVLDKDQRAQLASAIEAQLGHGALLDAGDVRRLAEDLKLDKEQRDHLTAWFKDQSKTDKESRAQAKERERKLLDAFKADKFQSELAYPLAAARTRPQEEADRLVAIAEQIHPTLNAEQRALAATMLRDRATGSAGLRF
jgi:Spy/CpxP family protein refolding chaperone